MLNSFLKIYTQTQNIFIAQKVDVSVELNSFLLVLNKTKNKLHGKLPNICIFVDDT